jgi:hypothetical protein
LAKIVRAPVEASIEYALRELLERLDVYRNFPLGVMFRARGLARVAVVASLLRVPAELLMVQLYTLLRSGAVA